MGSAVVADLATGANEDKDGSVGLTGTCWPRAALMSASKVRVTS